MEYHNKKLSKEGTWDVKLWSQTDIISSFNNVTIEVLGEGHIQVMSQFVKEFKKAFHDREF